MLEIDPNQRDDWVVLRQRFFFLEQVDLIERIFQFIWDSLENGNLKSPEEEETLALIRCFFFEMKLSYN